jgi:hypothetical protein
MFQSISIAVQNRAGHFIGRRLRQQLPLMQCFGPTNQIDGRGIEAPGSGQAAQIVIFEDNRTICGWTIAVCAVLDRVDLPVAASLLEVERLEDTIAKELAKRFTARSCDHHTEQQIVGVGIFELRAG